MIVPKLFISLVAGAGSALAGPVILLVGDSTVATQATSPGSGPGRGWGQVLPEFFGDDVTIHNAAVNGRSSKSFIDEGRWEKAIAEKPNYVFILWGTNDANKDPVRHTEPDSTFREYLNRYIDEAKAAGAVPVLVTPSAYRQFSPSGLFKDTLTPYAEAMKGVAAEKKVPLIDLNAATVALYEGLGPEESEKLAAKEGDRTHFNETGARKIAEIIVLAIPQAVPELKAHLASPK
jgi:lysophospholipase L1-like esterase